MQISERVRVLIGRHYISESSVQELLRASEEYAATLYPTESIHMLPQNELLADNVFFAVAIQGQSHETFLGCGAVVIQNGYAELKRMYVAENARGQGIGKRILSKLEERLKQEGVFKVMLETGISQPEAVSLYDKCGYVQRNSFGNYRDDPLSVFMEKWIN